MTSCRPSKRCKSCREMMESGAIIHKDIHNEKRWAKDPRRDEIEAEAEKSYREVMNGFNQVPENFKELEIAFKKARRDERRLRA